MFCSILKNKGIWHAIDEFRYYVDRNFRQVLNGIFMRIPLDRQLVYFQYRVRRCLPRHTNSNPLKLIYVDPDDVKYYHKGRPYAVGRVVDGDWDQNRLLLEEEKNCRQLLEKYYKRASNEKMDKRGLIHRFAIEGYYSQRKLLKDSNQPYKDNNDTPHPLTNEIGVNIYRDGSLAKKDAGNNRLCAAKAAGLDSIPVLVRTRHKEWESIKNTIRNADSAEDLPEKYLQFIDHPDVEGHPHSQE